MYYIHIYILYSVHRYRLVVHFRKNYIIYEETKIKKYWYLHLPPPYCDISGEVFEDKGQNLTFRINFYCKKTTECFFKKSRLKYQFRRTFFDNFNFRNDGQFLMTCLKVLKTPQLRSHKFLPKCVKKKQKKGIKKLLLKSPINFVMIQGVSYWNVILTNTFQFETPCT